MYWLHNNSARIICTQFRYSSTFPIVKLLSNKISNEEIQICGWITKLIKTSKCSFVHINDGSSSKSIQVVLDKTIGKNLGVGSSVQIIGKWVPSQGSQQPMELIATSCLVCNRNECPPVIGTPDIIRESIHLRAKHAPFASILRLRSCLHQLTHQFFMDNNFCHIDAPLMSLNDCEGAGEAFTIKNPNDDDYFGSNTVYLPVSGQLHLEAMAGNMMNVYTINPAFRAEKSLSRQHMAEFRMLEAECAFMDSLHDLCDLVERYIKFIVDKMKIYKEEIDTLDRFYDETLNKERDLPNLMQIVSAGQSFPRISYLEAVNLLEKLNCPVENGLNKKQELLLVREFNSPLFITHFPSNQKPFYMKRDKDEKLAECFDLLTPYVGELAGGSVRENDVKKLKRRNDIPTLDWYYELRLRGNPISSGFGLGIERFMQSLFGILTIKDTIPFPRWYKHIQC